MGNIEILFGDDSTEPAREPEISPHDKAVHAAFKDWLDGGHVRTTLTLDEQLAQNPQIEPRHTEDLTRANRKLNHAKTKE